jgi:predicted MFS family arabinose efflux permease
MEERRKFWVYENKALLILCCVFAYVWIDRNALSYLSPFVVKDLGLNNTQFGLIMSAFAIAWALSGYFGAFLSDRGPIKKKLLLFAVLIFAILSFLTGTAQSLIILIIVRIVLGVFEGPTLPLAQSIMMAESTESRRGFNMGMIQTTFPNIFSNFLGPICIVALAGVVGWRSTFYLTFVPGIILVLFIWKVLREPKVAGTENEEGKKREKFSPLVVLKSRNIKLSLITSPCVAAAFLNYFSFAPLYYSNVVGMDPTTMSVVVSTFGIGGIVWGFTVTGLSDKFGRKPIAILFLLIGLAACIGIITIGVYSPVLTGICCFFLATTAGCMVLIMSIIPSESVQPKMAATAIGTAMGFGELVGGSAAGVLTGFIADKYGLTTIFYFMIGCYVITIITMLFIKESAPAIVRKKGLKVY